MELTCIRFKELCLKDNNDEDQKIVDGFLKEFFNPSIKLNIKGVNDASRLISYICGGLDYEEFKVKGKPCDLIFLQCI